MLAMQDYCITVFDREFEHLAVHAQQALAKGTTDLWPLKAGMRILSTIMTTMTYHP
ncbi:hypothetical protein [Methylobacillus sp.]|uniref:hypothetical protein n=1 Tax=Methylobacillus sp. TaxID=56818 RepID=UPI00257976D1|nr:hypothetical protein [Methylobacillus sp.]